MNNGKLIDTMVNDALWDAFNQYHMMITIEPKSAAGVVLKAPPILPIAVRQAPAKTTFFDSYC